MTSEVADVVRYTDSSLQSEADVIELLSTVADQQDREHDILLTVDLGDRREGILPEDLVATVKRVSDCPSIRIAGLATNLGCFGGVIPTRAKMREFIELVEAVEGVLSRRLPVVSGGSSTTIPLLDDDEMPHRVSQLRVGGAILLGTAPSAEQPLPYLEQDAFTIEAEVVESKRRPSVPDGRIGPDAFGRKPSFEDRGIHRRAIVGLGRQDVMPDALTPLEPGVEILGASSDHLVLDVADATRKIETGDIVGFRPSYGAVLQAFTSSYVSVVYE
jgi:predicted amino acid racemase